MKLVVKVDNQEFEVKAIATSHGEANVICNLNPALSVIAEDRNSTMIFIAETNPRTISRREAMLPIGCLTNDGKLVNRP